MDLTHWAGVPRPTRTVLNGRYARLEPLNAARHGSALFASAQVPGAEDRFRYLFEEPPASMADFQPWLDKAAASDDPTVLRRGGQSNGPGRRAPIADADRPGPRRH